MKIVILYSSGLDSKIMKRYAEVKYPLAEVKCIYYAHGAESEEQEISLLPDFVEVRKIDWLGDKIKAVAKKEDPFAGAIYIPGRNLIFSALAACQEIADEIWMGTLWDEDNPKGTDKNATFRNLTSGVLSYVLSPFIDNVTVRFPFVEEKWSKQHAVEWALKNGLNAEEVMNTVSCWHYHGDRPCGKCKQCFKRNMVLFMNKAAEEYQNDVVASNEDLAAGYIQAALDGTNNRDELNVAYMLLVYNGYRATRLLDISVYGQLLSTVRAKLDRAKQDS